jgi:two-component system LytT family response regulator
MLKALIIDDESRARETISGMLRLYCPIINEITEADNIIEAQELLIKNEPDIVFLDVQMPGGGGFELLQQLKTINFKLVFITAYQEHAIKAFKFSAVDYLLKPLNPDELIDAVERARTGIENENISLRLDTLVKNMSIKEPEQKKIVIKTSESLHIIKVSDIIRCEADRNYTKFHLIDKKNVFVSTTIKEYEELLDKQGFFRVHQSHLINLSYISSFDKKDGGTLVMKDGSLVPVAVRKKEALLKMLTNTI